MNNTIALANTFLVFFFLLIVSVTSNIIQDSCQKAAKGDANVKVDFCVATLEANPKSKTATSLEALVPITIDMAISNATSISSKVSKLLENKDLDKYTRSCLETCCELYSDVPSDLQTAAQAVKSKDYGTANSYISEAMDAPDTCEEGFKEKEGSVSPLTKENSNFFQLTAMSLALMSMLK
ncbi:hypothetical protein PTKIN_Ptkin05aG0017300 [Pterospermum kingtungense]